MKIYTKTGDDGTTGLFGGHRVPKSDPRIELYGTIDELNAAIGLAVVVADQEMAARLREVQNDLFVIGSHLATPPESPSMAHLPMLDEMMVSRLEMQIDAADAKLAPLKQFILPGGVEGAARLHLARTICRRAERLLVASGMDWPIATMIVTYVNRLSDWLFVMARLENAKAGVGDVPWKKSGE
jgi:cob(I)alamin adenosyltransferase